MGHERGHGAVTEAQLKELYAGVMESRGAAAPDGRAGCPSPEAILGLVRREGDEAGRLATLDHVMSCQSCRGDLDLLRSIEEAGARLGAAETPGRRRWFMPAALAASLLLAVTLGRLAVRSQSDDDIVRSGDDATRAVALVAPPETVPAGAPIAFAWHPVAGAGRYRLEVLTGDGDVAVEAETPDTTITLDAVRRLAPGAYQWWVLAMTPGSGSPRSPLRPLRLTAR